MDKHKIGTALAAIGEALNGLSAEETRAVLEAANAAFSPPREPQRPARPDGGMLSR